MQIVFLLVNAFAIAAITAVTAVTAVSLAVTAVAAISSAVTTISFMAGISFGFVAAMIKNVA